ncbi:MAG: beta-propeller domain-containing protein [Desulfurococcales archaeon]|nr:beta-propeller domain-containing protein [Desulfurococcales archaeon]
MSLQKTLWKPVISGVIVFLVIIASFQIATNIHPYNNQTTTSQSTSSMQNEESLALINNNGVISFSNYQTLKVILDRYLSLYKPLIVQYGYPYMGLLYAKEEVVRAVGTPYVPATTVATMTTTANGIASNSGSPSYSKTNVQVSGIDEEDIAKTNGKYIALLSRNGALIVYKAYPPKKLDMAYSISLTHFIGKYNTGSNLTLAIVQDNKTVETLGQIHLLFANPKGLYITNESVIAVITSTYGVAYTYGYGPQYTIPVKTVTWVLKLDFKGKLLNAYWVDGDLVSSRFVAATQDVVLVTKEPIALPFAGSPIEPETINGPVPPQNIYLIGPPNFYSILTWLNISDWTERNVAVLGDEATIVYMPSPDTLYLVARSFQDMFVILRDMGIKYETQHSTTAVSGSNEIYISIAKTATTTEANKQEEIAPVPIVRLYPRVNNFTLIKAEMNGNEIQIVATANITGYISKQWQIDEYNGMLRIVTYDFEKKSVSLLILNATTLNTISRLNDIAVNERIHAVRFIGDRLYLVTYRNIDPLFYIDLSDPKNPRVVGYLKAPGFDEYMHPINSTLLIGVGRGEDWRNLRISTYRIEPNGTIEVLSRISIKHSWSPVLNSEGGHKAFLFYKEKDLIVIPVQDLYWKDIYAGLAVLKINETSGKLGVVKILKLFSTNSTAVTQETYQEIYRAMNRVRGLYIDDVLYMVNTEIEPYIIAYNLTTLTPMISSQPAFPNK